MGPSESAKVQDLKLRNGLRESLDSGKPPNAEQSAS